MPPSTNHGMMDRIQAVRPVGDDDVVQHEETAVSGAGNLPRRTMAEERGVSVRIALAEDEPDIRKMFVRLLERLGHEVIFAVSNGAELLDQSLEDNVDIVFVDLDMPVMDGLAAAEEVERKGIPVILVSGHPDSESVVLDEEPIVARITKPASLDSLRMAIEQALSGRE
jgi:CheY-like chemotaxis protein